jgi:DNA-binding NtrC family response regulator
VSAAALSKWQSVWAARDAPWYTLNVSSGREVETRTLDAQRRPRTLSASVRVLEARARPTEFELSKGSCKIGAGRDADIVVDDESVSRLHVELSLAPEGVAVQDLGSRNGTYYLGQRVDRAVLSLGSRLQIGRATIVLQPSKAALEQGIALDITSYGDLVGCSPAMRRVFGLLNRLEGSLVTVLVEGPSGTGKELIARALHDHSLVASGPFVPVNCGALDRTLARSELFGHRRGAFTGATDARSGAFEDASGGTLFLDEVGELPLEVQPLLLRALELGVVTRLGESNERPVKTRVVSATNRDLDAEVAAGRFREDLHYRLRVVRLRMPELVDSGDIELLARTFAERDGFVLPPDAIDAIRKRRWTGNGRELRNALRAYAALGVLDLPEAGASAPDVLTAAFERFIDLDRPYAELKEEAMQGFLQVYLRLLLARTGGNQSEAARISGLARAHIGRVLARRSSKDP